MLFKNIEQRKRSQDVCITGGANIEKYSSRRTFIWVKGSGDQTARLPSSCSFKIFLFYASCRTQSNSSIHCPLWFISYTSKRVCGQSSAGTQVYFLPTLCQPPWLHICCLNVLFASRSDAENTVVQDISSSTCLLGCCHHHGNDAKPGCTQAVLYWVQLQGSACSVSQDKGKLVNFPVTATQQKGFLTISFACSCLLQQMFPLFILGSSFFFAV